MCHHEMADERLREHLIAIEHGDEDEDDREERTAAVRPADD